MHTFKRRIKNVKAFWYRNQVDISVAVTAIFCILLFIIEHSVLNSPNYETSQYSTATPSIFELLVAILIVVIAALIARPVIGEVLTIIRYRSRLDLMVRQSLLFLAGLVIAVLLFLTWTPIPRFLGIEGMGGWQKLLTAGGVVTLTVATVGLVISYRRQRDAEDDKFNRDFADAASQLGDASPAVRIAGVYAMAALADNNWQRRQRCIDVLCGHLRIPYSPPTTQSGITERTIVEEVGKAVHTDTFAYQPGEREVRQSIVRVIRDRLRPEAASSWQGCEFDFTGAVFEAANFHGAVFSHGEVVFDKARFIGGIVNFQHTVFSGANVSFNLAEFSNAYVEFDFMRLQTGEVSFSAAKFRDCRVSFVLTTFEDGLFDFKETEVVDTNISYLSALFAGAYVTLDNSRFKNSTVGFEEACLEKGVLNLDFVTLENSQMRLDFAELSESHDAEISLSDPQLEKSRIVKDNQDFEGYRWPPYGV